VQVFIHTETYTEVEIVILEVIWFCVVRKWKPYFVIFLIVVYMP